MLFIFFAFFLFFLVLVLVLPPALALGCADVSVGVLQRRLLPDRRRRLPVPPLHCHPRHPRRNKRHRDRRRRRWRRRRRQLVCFFVLFVSDAVGGGGARAAWSSTTAPRHLRHPTHGPRKARRHPCPMSPQRASVRPSFLSRTELSFYFISRIRARLTFLLPLPLPSPFADLILIECRASSSRRRCGATPVRLGSALESR